MKQICISESLSLPLDATTQALAWLGRRGTGKSYGATKLAELMFDAAAQFVAIDPVGIWYGLRLGKDGKSKGLDIPIFGGLHGDIPLEAGGGALIADVIVSRNISAVLDVSQFEHDADKAKFATAFADRFFFLKKSSPSAVHVFVEEAQEFIPQNIQKGEERMLHAWQRMIRLGRNYGIGVSMITQRPQDVNKKALNQAECIFCFQLTGPQERKAVKGWISEHGLADDLEKTLPQLQQGYAHVWSPVWLDFNSEVHIAEKRTFAAGSTPKVGAKPVKIISLEPLELEQLSKEMAATIQRQKENDPATLKARIRELQEARIQSQPKEIYIADPKSVLEAVRERDAQWLNIIHTGQRRIHESLRGLAQSVTDVNLDIGYPTPFTMAPAKIGGIPVRTDATMPRNQLDVLDHNGRRPAITNIGSGSGEKLPKTERTILTALAQYPQGRTKVQIALLGQYAHTGGGFNNALSALRSKGYITDGEPITITQAGVNALGSFEALPVGRELLEYWYRNLGKAERSILEVVARSYPRSITKESVAAAAGYEPSGGGFNNALSRLRSFELVAGKAELKASDDLFN